MKKARSSEDIDETILQSPDPLPPAHEWHLPKCAHPQCIFERHPDPRVSQWWCCKRCREAHPARLAVPAPPRSSRCPMRASGASSRRSGMPGNQEIIKQVPVQALPVYVKRVDHRGEPSSYRCEVPSREPRHRRCSVHRGWFIRKSQSVRPLHRERRPRSTNAPKKRRCVRVCTLKPRHSTVSRFCCSS